MDTKAHPIRTRGSDEAIPRTQPLRTVARIPLDLAIIETADPPAYQRIAREALRLARLGLPALRIARVFWVTDKTVTKAVRWLRSRPE